ncbi:MAG: hypothetical protein KBC74_01375 [Candidatus Pacebacteria bacterium]|nr:hypothetical protein [Candidatus Paceibacterota bacterium]
MTIKKTFYALTHLFVFGVFIFICGTIFTPEHEARAALSKRVFLTSGTTWTVPADWSDVDTIETIGGGGHGAQNNNGGGSGGGGAYASITNLDLTAGASVTYRVMATSDTVFNTSATTCAGSPTPSVCATAGTSASGNTNGTGGLASGSVGTIKYSGSDGSFGGGSAAGPSGDALSYAADNGFGGSQGDAGSDYCGDLSTDGGPGGSGYPGYEYDTLPGHGSGGGGGMGGSAGPGGFTGGAGGAGGSYGGGGGGGGSRCGIGGTPGGAGNGAGGLIIITYTSTETGSTSLAKFKIKGGRFIIKGGSVRIK